MYEFFLLHCIIIHDPWEWIRLFSFRLFFLLRKWYYTINNSTLQETWFNCIFKTISSDFSNLHIIHVWNDLLLPAHSSAWINEMNYGMFVWNSVWVTVNNYITSGQCLSKWHGFHRTVFHTFLRQCSSSPLSTVSYNLFPREISISVIPLFWCISTKNHN